MAEHLSWLVADEVAAGLRAVPPHAGTCAVCQERLRQAAAAHARVLKAPAYAKELDRLTASSRRPPWTRRIAPAFALAAALALVVWMRPFGSSGERLKGAPVLEVREAGTTVKVAQARVGSRISLAIGGAGHRYGLVVAIDNSGRVSTLWQGQVPPGVGATVAPEFEVTPGALTLFAFYADEPLDPNRVLHEVQDAALRAQRAGRSPLEGAPAPVPGERARVKTTLDVDAGTQ